jgi:glycosyltransferase involved in cell wall biosynthesis
LPSISGSPRITTDAKTDVARILLIAGSQSRVPSLAASSVQVMRMAAALAGLGHAVTLVVPRGRGDLAGLHAPDLGAFYGVPVRFAIERYAAPGRSRLAELCYASAAHRCARREPWDLILSRNPLATVLLARSGIAHTFEAHQVRLAGRVDHWHLNALRSPYVERIVAIAGALVPELTRLGIPPEKVLVAADAADPEDDMRQLTSGGPAPAATRSGASFVCLYAGSLSSMKGMGTLLAAARRLPEIDFLIVGGIPAPDLASHRIAAGQNVRFTGAVPPSAVPALLRTADVLVLPHGAASASRYLSPLKLFEYLAAGRAIVASDLPALREVLLDGQNAVLVPPDDAGALAAAIGALRSSPELRARLGRAAAATAERHTWRRRAETILEGRALPGPDRLLIGHLLNSFHPLVGGAERQAAAIAREQVRDGHEVHVLTRRRPGLPAAETLDGIAIHRLPLRGMGALGFVAAGVRFLRTRRRPFDVLHAHQARANAAIGLAARALGGPPVVIKVAGLDVPRGGQPGNRARAAMLRRADAVVALTTSMRDEVAALGVSSARLHVIPNGVDGEHHRPASARERAAARSALDLAPQARVVLFAGRLTAIKGPDLLLDAWAKLRSAGDLLPHDALLVAGDGPLAAALGESARAAGGDVRFLGEVADPAPLYRAADVLALPSRSEGLSNTLLEAMASGLAIVATAVGGNREVIRDGDTGRLTAAEPRAFAAALAELLANAGLRAAMGEAAANAARGRYDLRAVAARYEDLYRSLRRADRASTG